MKRLRNLKFLLAPVLILVLVATPIHQVYSSTLTLTVFTARTSYAVGEDITLYGNLLHDASPIPNWPVALQVQDPTGVPVVTRAPQTNTTGTYTVTFRLRLDSGLGTYTAYVGASYKGETASSSVTFELIELLSRDVAVTNVMLSKTVIAQGYFMNVTATVENQGYTTETFNVTVYGNTTAIGTQTVRLTSHNFTSVTFPWNTTNAACGNYTVSAYA